MGPRTTVNGGNLGRHVAKARSAALEIGNRSETEIERFLFLTTALHTCKMVNGGAPNCNGMVSDINRSPLDVLEVEYSG
jgi:hypothetical protein